jgi:hypothetical protein
VSKNLGRRKDKHSRGRRTRELTPKEAKPRNRYVLVVGKPFIVSQPSRREVWLDRLKTAVKWTSAIVAIGKLLKRLFDNLSG